MSDLDVDIEKVPTLAERNEIRAVGALRRGGEPSLISLNRWQLSARVTSPPDIGKVSENSLGEYDGSDLSVRRV